MRVIGHPTAVPTPHAGIGCYVPNRRAPRARQPVAPRGGRRLTLALLALSAIALVVAACGNTTTFVATLTATVPIGQARYPIKHVIIIMRENRSFDSYFGTYPGADGIPMQNGVPTVCVPDPKTNQCVKPFHDPLDLNHGGPHGQTDAFADIDRGKMDGFIAQEEASFHTVCTGSFDPECTTNTAQPDVMGWHDAREIPNYWSYAEHYVLQDHMFEPNASWSLPAHLFMLSARSAH